MSDEGIGPFFVERARGVIPVLLPRCSRARREPADPVRQHVHARLVHHVAGERWHPVLVERLHPQQDQRLLGMARCDQQRPGHAHLAHRPGRAAVALGRRGAEAEIAEQAALVVARIGLAGDVDEVRSISAVRRDCADDPSLLHHEEAAGVCRRLQDQHGPREAPAAQGAPQVDRRGGTRGRKTGGVRRTRIEPVDGATVGCDGLVRRAAGATGAKRCRQRERARDLTSTDRHAATIGTPPTGDKRAPRRSRTNTLRRIQSRAGAPWAVAPAASAALLGDSDFGYWDSMFIGHFAVAFGAKKAVPRTSVATLMVAAELVDLLWPILVLLGIETVQIDAGAASPFLRLRFVHYPWTHSLLMGVLWGIGFGIVYRARTSYARGALAIAILVVSHWVLDWVVHRPDLQFAPWIDTRVGLGLWASPTATLVVEAALFIAGVGVYARATRPRDRIAAWGFWGFVAFLVVAYASSIAGGAPPSPQVVAATALLGWAMVPWIAWFDRHRDPAGQPLAPSR